MNYKREKLCCQIDYTKCAAKLNAVILLLIANLYTIVFAKWKGAAYFSLHLTSPAFAFCSIDSSKSWPCMAMHCA